MLSDLLLLAPALGVFVILLLLRSRGTTKTAAPRGRTKTKGPPPNAIVVDGSNVMHWGGKGPSSKVLSRVLRSLENKGYAPFIFFDASVGYKLDDHYYDAYKLAHVTGVHAGHIRVVNKGEIADVAILAFAGDHGLRIVTNDQFRDWRVQFPHAGHKERLIKGSFREGAVRWKGRL